MANKINFKAIVQSADASSGVVATFYRAGSDNAILVDAEDIVQVHSVVVSSAIQTLVDVFFGTQGASNTIVRANVPADGTVHATFPPGQMVGSKGEAISVDTGAAGVVSATITGTITRLRIAP